MPGHHAPIVTVEEHARVLVLLCANASSPYYNHQYQPRVIWHGLLAGFIPMNVAFGGYDAGHYLGALVMARVARVDIQAEIACIAGVKRVRREFLGERGAATLTLSSYGLAFSAGCVSLMKNVEYVEVLLHPSEQLLAVRKCSAWNPDAVPWSKATIAAKELSRVVYDLMNWRRGWKYKCVATCFAKGGLTALMFDLRCCEYRLPQTAQSRRLARAVPGEGLSSFGSALPDQLLLCRRALAKTLGKWNIYAAATPVERFVAELRPLSRREVERRIAEMRAIKNG